MQNTMQTNASDDTIEIDLQEMFVYLIHWVWLIVICGIVAGAVGYTVSSFVMTPQYKSTTRVYILNKSDNSTITYSDVQLGTSLTKDYAQLVTSRYVLESVIEKYDLKCEYEAFLKKVSVETPTDTRLLAITVTDPNPQLAKELADEIRVIASEHIKNVMDIEAVNVVDEANLAKYPSSPNVNKNTVIAMILGVFACAAVLIIKFLLDDTIKTSEDVEKYLGLSTLAIIPIMEDPDKLKKKNHITDTYIDNDYPEEDYVSPTVPQGNSVTVNDLDSKNGEGK